MALGFSPLDPQIFVAGGESGSLIRANRNNDPEKTMSSKEYRSQATFKLGWTEEAQWALEGLIKNR